MPDEEIGQTEGSFVPDEGQTTGSESAATEAVEGNPPAEANPQAPEIKPQFGQFGEDANKLYEGYKALESKLGNWNETEELANKYRELQANPPVAETPEEVPDFQAMTQEEQLAYLRADARKEAEKAVQEAIAKEVKPLQQDVYTRQANEAAAKIKEKYPDIEQHKDAINKFLDDNPAIAANLNPEVFDIAYRYVTYEKVKELGAKDAIAKLSQKASKNTPQPMGSVPVTSTTPKSFMEALRQAEDEVS